MSTITKEFTKEQLIEDLKSSTQNASGMFEISEDTICALMSMIYAAPQLPQPAVPDIATVETTYPDVQTNWQDAKMYAEGWNAYRAAMLQSFGNSEQLNSPVIPDGWADMLQRWLVFGRGMQNAGSQLPRNLIAETEAMLAAAPQQEVK